ncbi:hypothetical protein B566_EDAN007851 [Ephemera danica]|nr:hypothetical protein B566_EDAN007851 [Ephemera danica]
MPGGPGGPSGPRSPAAKKSIPGMPSTPGDPGSPLKPVGPGLPTWKTRVFQLDLGDPASLESLGSHLGLDHLHMIKHFVDKSKSIYK